MPPPLRHVPPCTGAQLSALEAVFRRHVRRLRLAYRAWLGAAAPYVDDATHAAVARCLAVADALDGTDSWAHRRELLVGGGVDALNLCVWALTPRATRSAAADDQAALGADGVGDDDNDDDASFRSSSGALAAEVGTGGEEGSCRGGDAAARRALLMASLRIVAYVEYYTTQIALIVGCATEVIRTDDELRTCIATLHMNRAAKRSQLAAPAFG
jgi:hypothetical protein